VRQGFKLAGFDVELVKLAERVAQPFVLGVMTRTGKYTALRSGGRLPNQGLQTCFLDSAVSGSRKVVSRCVMQSPGKLRPAKA
jgi:hypothetical protein